LGAILAAPLFVAIPISNFFARMSTTAVWSYLIILTPIRVLAAQLCFSSVTNLVSNSVDPSNMGEVNGKFL
jgi:hypothetical protein